MKSVKSINPFKSVVQTNYDISESQVDNIKVETKDGEGAIFIIQLPLNNI